MIYVQDEELLIITKNDEEFAKLKEFLPDDESMIDDGVTVYRGSECKVSVWYKPESETFEAYTEPAEVWRAYCARCGTSESTDPDAWEINEWDEVIDHYCEPAPALKAAIVYAVRSRVMQLSDAAKTLLEKIALGDDSAETLREAIKAASALSFPKPSLSQRLLTRLRDAATDPKRYLEIKERITF